MIFGFRKHKKKKEVLIDGFDADAYLKANPDVERAIRNGQFRDAYHHLEAFGLKEIQKGVRKYHDNCDFYNEHEYIRQLQQTHNAEAATSAFEHFCKYGYKASVGKSQKHIEKNTNKKVLAVVGIPRSGLTLTTALTGLVENTGVWLLPYATRKGEGIKPFQDYADLEKSFMHLFPGERISYENMVISESTASTENMPFMFESLQNLQKNGVDVKVIWVVRNINHTFLSQMEAAHKYWGAETNDFSEADYKTYIDFAVKSFSQIVQTISEFEHSIMAYENIVSDPRSFLETVASMLGSTLKNSNSHIDLAELKKKISIAGDPGFEQYDSVQTNRSGLRDKVWQDVAYYEKSLPHLQQSFVSDFNTMVKRTRSSSSFTLNEHLHMLLEEAFDASYYLEQYPDIQAAGADPYTHYMTFGWKEDRNPAAWFDNRWYRENIFDDHKTPPLKHYVKYEKYRIEPDAMRGKVGFNDLVLTDPETYEITDDLLLCAPACDIPKVSIIIPVYNQEKYTLACIQSIIENTDRDIPYEIIVMDDNSPDPAAREIRHYLQNITFVVNDENCGFLKNCNRGAAFAKGEYMLFLNNDTNVQPQWLSSLVELIESSDDIGMVGSRLVYPSGRQQEAGGIVWKDASGWNFGRLDDPNKPEYNYVKEADYLTGAAMMVRTSLWKAIGGFDNRYVPAYYEDTDLAFEARKRGYRTLYQPKSIVVHYEGISNGTDIGAGIKQHQVSNQKKFYNKWKHVLEKEHFPNAEDIFLARDRSASKRHLLYVDHYLPHYDQDAGSKATFQYLKILSQNNIQVHFIGDNFYDYPDTPYLDALQQLGIEVLHGNWYANHWKEWFAEHGKYFDYAVISRPHIAVKYVDTIRKYSDAKIIYMGHDLHFLREAREYTVKGDGKYLESSRQWQKREMDLIHRCDVSYFFSTVEKEEILRIDPDASVDVVPLYIYDTFSQREHTASEREDIMFVGGFGHSPNIDAMIWFVKEIWPMIVQQLPEIKLYIIGSNAPEEIVGLASENVIVTGYVDDKTLDMFYEKCKVVVAPLRYGAGIKGKIVDALYKGMPIVTTPIGAEGLTDAERAMRIADKPETFAEYVIELYRNDVLSDEFAKSALSYCRKHFSVQNAKEKMAHVFNEFKEEK